MCGIIGVVDKYKKLKVGIEELNNFQHHRGPDDAGYFEKKSVGLNLAMTRLAIVDVDVAHQPFVSKDGYVVIFNGEIFNVEALRDNVLNSSSNSLKTNYEAELIYILFRQYGEKFLDMLNGMFAISIYNPKKNSLLIARDRFGIKPLHYFKKGDIFCFSSEITPLVKCLDGQASLDYESVENYFSLGCISNPSTIYSEIKQLSPGSIVNYDLSSNRLKIRRWWINNVKINNHLNANDWYQKINYQLQKSMKVWSFSDVPVTYLLSGGLDSSALVALAAINSTKPIKTYSLGFEGEGEESWNELKIAKDVSKKYGTDHTEIILNPDILADSLDKMSKHLEQPYAGGLPSWAVFEEISKEHRVAVVGTGGDEIFGNYNRGRKFNSLISSASQNINVFSELFSKSFQDAFYIIDDKKSEEILIKKEYGSKLLNKMSKLYQSYSHIEIDDLVAQLSIDTQLVDEFLMMTDRFSMAHSVEARTPYLDHELVNLLFSMPNKYRVDYDNYKSALKGSIGHLLPKSVLQAKKHGFNIPLSLWMRGRLRDLVEDLIGVSALKHSEFIKPDFYNSYVKPMLNGDNSNIALIWSVLMFQFWLKKNNF
jgi:asparagine synthase (glutamine-hydrolysing)